MNNLPFVSRIIISTSLAVATMTIACKQQGADSQVQTLDKLGQAGGQGSWAPNQCGGAQALASLEPADRTMIQNCVETRADGLQGNADMARKVLAAAPLKIVRAFCQTNNKVVVSNDLANANCHNTDFDNVFLDEGGNRANKTDYRTCFARGQNNRLEVLVNSKDEVIQHTLIRSMAYFYAKVVLPMVAANNDSASPGVALEQAYMNVLRVAFIKDLQKFNPAQAKRLAEADAKQVTDYVFADAVDQAHCTQETEAAFPKFTRTYAVYHGQLSEVDKQQGLKGASITPFSQQFPRRWWQ